MKKQIVFIVIFSCLLCVKTLAQQIGYSYQTLVSRQSAGLGVDVQEILKDYPVKVRFTLRVGSESGDIRYREEHETQTNAFGILNAIVGSGFKQAGDELQSLDWADETYYLQVEIDLDDGEGYMLMSSEPILVPPHAKAKDQELALDGSILSISGDPGTSVDLDPVIGQEGVNGDELQELEVGDAPGEISISKRNGVVINVEDDDADPTNENQTVSAGSGIVVNRTEQNFEIANTAPDQEITLMDGGSGNVIVGGVYPDFTIDVGATGNGAFSTTNNVTSNSPGNLSQDDFCIWTFYFIWVVKFSYKYDVL